MLTSCATTPPETTCGKQYRCYEQAQQVFDQGGWKPNLDCNGEAFKCVWNDEIWDYERTMLNAICSPSEDEDTDDTPGTNTHP
jgi:hypothetical protein